jgi:hypothetical protein
MPLPSSGGRGTSESGFALTHVEPPGQGYPRKRSGVDFPLHYRSSRFRLEIPLQWFPRCWLSEAGKPFLKAANVGRIILERVISKSDVPPPNRPGKACRSRRREEIGG